MKFDYKTIAKIKIASEIMRDGFTMQDINDFLASHGIRFRGGINSSKKWAAEESLKGAKSKKILDAFFADLLVSQYWSYEKPVKLIRRLGVLVGERVWTSSQAKKKRGIVVTIDSFHQIIKKASKDLFIDGHYSQAVFEACKVLKCEVQKISGLKDQDGVPLMHAAFSPSNPKIKLNQMETKTEKDEQQGFMELFAGTMGGIRNPRGHEEILDKDPKLALEVLSMVDFLLRKLANRVSPKVIN